eukprot:m.108228 g.108228  ORF g.108228 m.108228 type:complete len:68 (-) comp12794_c0_seq4:55-258(-)
MCMAKRQEHVTSGNHTENNEQTHALPHSGRCVQCLPAPKQRRMNEDDKETIDRDRKKEENYVSILSI